MPKLIKQPATAPPLTGPALWERAPKDNIRCAGERIPLASLRPDPGNANLHPERSITEIKNSLAQFGQMSPITVRKADMVVMKGNGTLEALIELGWTVVACSVVEMEALESMLYGVADNRVAQFAQFDLATVARYERLAADAGIGMPGWDMDDLIYLRSEAKIERWNPPLNASTDADFAELWKGMPEFFQEDKTSFRTMTIHFRNEDDIKKFLSVIGQTIADITQKGGGLWFPRNEIERYMDKRYINKNGQVEEETDAEIVAEDDDDDDSDVAYESD